MGYSHLRATACPAHSSYSLVSAKLAALVQSERSPRPLVPEAYGSDADHLSPGEKRLYPTPQAAHQAVRQRENAVVGAVLRGKDSGQIGVSNALGLGDIVSALLRREEVVEEEASRPRYVQVFPRDTLGYGLVEDCITVADFLEVLLSSS